jgi:hypothetical protein
MPTYSPASYLFFASLVDIYMDIAVQSDLSPSQLQAMARRLRRIRAYVEEKDERLLKVIRETVDNALRPW